MIRFLRVVHVFRGSSGWDPLKFAPIRVIHEHLLHPGSVRRTRVQPFGFSAFQRLSFFSFSAFQAFRPFPSSAFDPLLSFRVFRAFRGSSAWVARALDSRPFA